MTLSVQSRLFGFLLLLALVVTSIIYFNARLDLVVKRQTFESVGVLIEGVFKLNIITSEHLNKRSKRSLQQWERSHASLTNNLLQSMRGVDDEVRASLGQIRNDLINIRSLFFKIEVLEKLARPDTRILVNSIKPQLNIITHGIVSKVSSLGHKTLSELQRKEASLDALVLWVGASLALLFILIVFWIQKSFLNPIFTLKAYADTLILGDYKTKIPVRGKDEIADLSSAFNNLADTISEKIHELNQSLAATTANQQQLRAILDNIIDGVVTIDERGTVEFFSPSAERIFGYRAEEVVGRNVNMLMPEPYHGEHDTYIANYLETGEAKIIGSGREVIGRRKDGSSFPMELGISEVNQEGRRLFTGSLHDITERKHAEEEIVRKEEQLRIALDNMSSGLRLIDKDRNYVLFNSQYLKLYDFPEGLLKVGESFRVENLYQAQRGDHGPGDPEELTDKWFAEWKGPTVTKSWERRTVGGKILQIDTSLTPDGGIVNIVSDITELIVARDRAKESDRLKSTFLAVMSHELRTPLNSIIGFTGIVLKGLAGPLSEEQTKQLGMARGSARHLLELINDVLDISKIEAGEVEIVPKAFDVREAIEKAVQKVIPSAEKKGLVLAVDVAPEVGRITSDRRRVEQILINLMNNAVKFSEHGEVRIECRLSGDRLVTCVKDTGIGINPEDVNKLFIEFQQLDTGLNRKQEGTGLGLSICKKLVALLGGDIRVESKPGEGSVFTFTLPLKAGG